jgi:hypothetical protein
MSEILNNIEFQETLSILENKGLGSLMKLLLERDSEAYTRNGRLNKSALCRKLKFTSKELENGLLELRKAFS